MASPRLGRRVVAEGVGTALLVAAIVGSGIAAQRLSPGEVGLQLLANTLATAAGLVALILAFGPVSGGHLNPVVTLAARADGASTTAEAAAYVAAQAAGACVGAMVANVMFELPMVNVSGHVRSGGPLWLAEVVATFGLVTVILGVVRGGRPAAVPFAVAGYVAAAYWFTSSTSFANPAVTVGRTLSDTFAGIAPASAPGFVAAQLAGGALAVGLARYLYAAPAVSPSDPHDVRSTPMPDRDVPRPGRQPDPPSAVPVVVFLCVHNAGRSQMARGWFEHLAGGRAVARSGGSEPAEEVNPVAVRAMAEVGIDIAGAHPARWADEVVRAADVVVTMGCGDTCPVFPGTRYEDWELEDPAGKDLDVVRRVRDEIGGRVRGLLADLLPEPRA